MTAPSVAIIIPCYNGARYMSGLVASLRFLAGEYRELILVDDGSEDGSAALFARLMPEAIVLSQQNAGVAVARNTGAQAAQSDFIQLLDADDIIRPGKLARQAAFAERESLDVVYSDWRMAIVNGGVTTYEPVMNQPMPTEPVASLLGGWWAPPHAYLIRRSAYAAIGGSDPNLVNAQDYDLVVRLAISGERFGYLPGHFADYYRYVDTTSLARGPRRRYWQDYETATERAVAELDEAGALTVDRRRAAARKFHTIARSVYSIDKAWFSRMVVRLYELDPKFRPSSPALYALFARLAGLHSAESVASWSRKIRLGRERAT